MALVPRPTDIEAITLNAGEVRSYGTRISEIIRQFEGWLSILPGRVVTRHLLWSDPSDDSEFYLVFAKHGKEWKLLTSLETDRDPERVITTPLRDEDLDTKIAAVEAFPRMVEAMGAAQRTLVARMSKTIAAYDELADKYGIKEGK